MQIEPSNTAGSRYHGISWLVIRCKWCIVPRSITKIYKVITITCSDIVTRIPRASVPACACFRVRLRLRTSSISKIQSNFVGITCVTTNSIEWIYEYINVPTINHRPYYGVAFGRRQSKLLLSIVEMSYDVWITRSPAFVAQGSAAIFSALRHRRWRWGIIRNLLRLNPTSVAPFDNQHCHVGFIYSCS